MSKDRGKFPRYRRSLGRQERREFKTGNERKPKQIMNDDEKLIKRIDEFGKNLTDWEVQFISEMVNRTVFMKKNKRDTTLTERQRKLLERIEKDRVD